MLRYLVLGSGVFILTVTAIVVVSPTFLRLLLSKMIGRGPLAVVSLLRLGLGIGFLFAAPFTRGPQFVRLFGIVLILAAVSAPILGLQRLTGWATWWMERSDGIIRGCGVIGVALGGALLWSGGWF